MIILIASASIAAARVSSASKGETKMITTWKNKDGSEILITDLDNHHLLNAYKFSIRMICERVGDMDNAMGANEDGHIDDQEMDFFENRNRVDLLDIIAQKDALKAECRARGIEL